MPNFFLHWGREGRKALPHVATLGSAGGCGQDGGRGDGGDGGDGCGAGGPWKSTVEAVVTVPSAGDGLAALAVEGGGNFDP